MQVISTIVKSRIHVADGDDEVEVVMAGVVSFAISGSYPEIPDNCLFKQFTFSKENGVWKILGRREYWIM